MKYSKPLSILLLVVLVTLLTPIRARADMAPPEGPPGTNIVPGSETTQVRMVAETVTMTVRAKPSEKYLGQADTEAIFTMRNLSAETETMDARFPLTFYGFGYPDNEEINDLQVFIAGKPVQTTRIQGSDSFPWAAFPVSFPPGQDVIVTVKYTTNSGFANIGFILGPTFSLNYILETGAGWKDTIGSADIIIKLPYEASLENVLYDPASSTKKLTFVGKEVCWHLSDFEPSNETNFYLSLVRTEYWQKVLEYRENVKQHPSNGEFWGQLGKAIKEVLREAKGYLRNDAVGEKLYQESFSAYQKSVELLPDDALWHYGFADLVWSHHFFSYDKPDLSAEEMTLIADQLRQALALDPDNVQIRELADSIAGFSVPYIRKNGDVYDFPVLTATLTAILPTGTPTPEATSTLQPVPATWTAAPAAATDAPVSPTKTPGAGLPLCGGGALPAALAIFWLAAKRKRAARL